MTGRAAIAGFALGAVLLAARAAEPVGAPLADSKRELKALQAEQATKANPSGKIMGNVPDVGAPTPGEMPIDLTSSIKTEKELKKKTDARKNWLLDGMDQLGQNSKGTNKDTRDTGEVKNAADEEKPAEGDTLLKLYSEQKKKDEARTEARTAAVARNDPFAPFLQGWLANSPAIGKPFEGSGRKPDAVGGTVAAPGPASGAINFSQSAGGPSDLGGTRGQPMPVNPQPNPYLETPVGPALTDFSAIRNQGSAANIGTSTAVPLPNPALGEPAPASRTAEKKPQFLRPSDNDKYFPQQKKF